MRSKVVETEVRLLNALSALEQLAIKFQDEVKGPLGFHAEFVNAKLMLRSEGRELPERKG